MFLLDTNIWLELLLEQEKSEDVKTFLQDRNSQDLAITEFSIYSIGIILGRLEKLVLFENFLSDIIIDSSILRICLNEQELISLIDIMKRFSLDFDDSYQYIAAKNQNFTLLSFDSDFDRTDLARKTPVDFIKQ